MKTTLILGAGFSKNSGLPIQSEIPALLTKYKEIAILSAVFPLYWKAL